MELRAVRPDIPMLQRDCMRDDPGRRSETECVWSANNCFVFGVFDARGGRRVLEVSHSPYG